MAQKCFDKNILNEREKYWIDKLNTIQNGYNLIKGGDGGDTSMFIDYNNEQYRENKKNIAEIYWKNISEEDRKIRSEKVKGDKNPMYGKVGFWKGKNINTNTKRKPRFKEKNSNWKGGKTFCKCGTKINSGAKSCIKCRDISGENNPFYNKTHSQEFKDDLRDKRLGKYNGNQEKALIIDGKEYKSLSYAARELKVVVGTILFRLKSKHFEEYKYK